MLNHPPSHNFDEARFWSRVEVRGPDDCWPWTAGKDRDGYGVIRFDPAVTGKAKRHKKAHRVAFFIEHGRWPEPAGLHRCGNFDCCNVRHIYEGTIKEAMRLRDERGHGSNNLPTQVGTQVHTSKLTPEEVRRIRARYAEECRDDRKHGALTRIGKEFHVTKHTIRKIINGDTWGHV
jgi:hypothetical protein